MATRWDGPRVEGHAGAQGRGMSGRGASWEAAGTRGSGVREVRVRPPRVGWRRERCATRDCPVRAPGDRRAAAKAQARSPAAIYQKPCSLAPNAAVCRSRGLRAGPRGASQTRRSCCDTNQWKSRVQLGEIPAWRLCRGRALSRLRWDARAAQPRDETGGRALRRPPPRARCGDCAAAPGPCAGLIRLPDHRSRRTLARPDSTITVAAADRAAKVAGCPARGWRSRVLCFCHRAQRAALVCAQSAALLR